VLLVLALTSCVPSSATAPTAPVLLAPHEIASKPGYLELKALVANQSGNPIPGLKQADFIADTSGMRLPIVFLHENAQAPMSIGILIDTSGSMSPKLDTIKLKLGEFIDGLSSSDEVCLIAFSSRPRLLQPLTTDHQAIVQKLSLLSAFGQTSIYDSIIQAVLAVRGASTSKAILLITDGMDNASRARERDAVASLKETGVRMYAIGIGDTNVTAASMPLWFGADDSVDAKGLQDMARDAGGEAFIVPPMAEDDGKGFSSAVNAVSGMLGDSYSVGVVVPPRTAASTLRLAIANHPDAVVTTRIVNSPPPP
jgi:VWFA-related protein